MSIARLTESIRRAGEGISEPRKILLADLSRLFDAPPPSTIRRIVREWDAEGIELGGHRVRTQKLNARLYLVIDPSSAPERSRALPLYHQFGRIMSA